MNLADVRDRVAHDDTGKWDRVIERDELRLQDGRLRLPRSWQTDSVAAGTAATGATAVRGLKLTDWATAQMCQKLGIPTAYYRRCPAPLQDAQVNHWLYRSAVEGAQQDPPEQDESPQQQHRHASVTERRWLVRVKADTARGILSERYAKLNNADILECLSPVLQETPFQVGWFAVTDESLHLRLFDPRLSREVLPGDRVVAGLHIGNSEVGKRAITVDALVYRLVCKNGLVRLVKGKSLLHHRHLGFGKADLGAGLSSAIREALVQSSGFMERLDQATREFVPDVEKALAALAEEINLSEKVVEQVTAALGQERHSQRDTLYGLVNALTFTAQSLAPDERYTLETAAGRLLEGGLTRDNRAAGANPPQRLAPAGMAAATLPSLPTSAVASLRLANGGNGLSLFGKE